MKYGLTSQNQFTAVSHVEETKIATFEQLSQNFRSTSQFEKQRSFMHSAWTARKFSDGDLMNSASESAITYEEYYGRLRSAASAVRDGNSHNQMWRVTDRASMENDALAKQADLQSRMSTAIMEEIKTQIRAENDHTSSMPVFKPPWAA